MIYNNTQGISSANDLIQIVNIGNQLYSSLSRLARQAHLMQSELPTALNVFDTDYQLEYSESYSGTVHLEIAIEGYQCCTSLRRFGKRLTPLQPLNRKTNFNQVYKKNKTKKHK